MKLTAGVNFINILHSTFSYKSVLRSSSLHAYILAWKFFCQWNIGKKVAHNKLMKWSTGANFTNILQADLWFEIFRFKILE
jgi:hypothetical protein